ncbi:MAG: hypothetical protein PHE50_05690 [Dehalococcoidales bacterium]|nr:hypothetical protein [Dehalococcoidales bacterium]
MKNSSLRYLLVFLTLGGILLTIYFLIEIQLDPYASFVITGAAFESLKTRIMIDTIFLLVFIICAVIAMAGITTRRWRGVSALGQGTLSLVLGSFVLAEQLQTMITLQRELNLDLVLLWRLNCGEIYAAFFYLLLGGCFLVYFNRTKTKGGFSSGMKKHMIVTVNTQEADK